MKLLKSTFAMWGCLTLILSYGGVVKSVPGGGCTVNGVTYKIGDTWPGSAGDCQLYSCTAYDGSYSAVSCSVAFVRPGSKCTNTPGDPSALYPNCCSSIVCPDFE